MEQLVARRAHNPKVVSSSLTPATIEKQTPIYGVCFFYYYEFSRLELTTGGSKFGDIRAIIEQRIWEKQSGGLFRSDCYFLGLTPATIEKRTPFWVSVFLLL